MKKIFYISAALSTMIMAFTSCNDEWKEEQYTNYISLKSDEGVTEIYVPYSRKDTSGNYVYGEGKSDYQLPVIVSGSLLPNRSFEVHIAHDPDTLAALNYAQFQNRTDLYYSDMIDYASFDEVVNIPKKQKIGLLNVKFDFTQGASGEGIDMVYKWVLPLTVVKDDAYDYKAHPRKGYAKALLRVLPFNDYSGDYSGTSLKFFSTGDEANATVFNTARGYVVDEKTIFFYAGNVTELRTDRKNYKIYFHFNGDREGTVDIYTDNPNIKLKVLKEASFRIIEKMDEVQPYLKNRYLIINNVNYNYVDYSSIPGSELKYSVKGSLTLLRKINTQIPDEDQAIEW